MEEVAAGKRAFPQILGRDQEYILTREGVRLVGLNNIPKEIKNIFQMQLIQLDYDTVIIRVAAMPGYSEDDAKQIMAQARVKIPASIDVRIETAAICLLTKEAKRLSFCAPSITPKLARRPCLCFRQRGLNRFNTAIMVAAEGFEPPTKGL